MKYIDMHCDTVTECFGRGYSLTDCGLQTDLEKLKKGKCAAQCFAIYTQGDSAARRFKDCLEFYKGSGVSPVLDYSGLEACLKGEKTGAVLTVENLGFIGEDLPVLNSLAEEGVKMASLVWNIENALAFPNVSADPSAREKRGLKPLGRKAVEILDELKIIVDISHLSDGGAEDILTGRKIPAVASHSNSAEVCNVSRNLTDGLIKKIAGCGGVIGVCFCKKFLGGGGTFEKVFEHIRRIINAGGEEAVAIGSDFDGIPAPEDLEDCTKMPALFAYLKKRGLKYRTLEKLCYKNFARVFKEVCG